MGVCQGGDLTAEGGERRFGGRGWVPRRHGDDEWEAGDVCTGTTVGCTGNDGWGAGDGFPFPRERRSRERRLVARERRLVAREPGMGSRFHGNDGWLHGNDGWGSRGWVPALRGNDGWLHGNDGWAAGDGFPVSSTRALSVRPTSQ